MSDAEAATVLRLRKEYKNAKRAYRTEMAKPVEPAAVPLKKKRVKREGPPSDAQKANAARLKAVTARAKEIRAADPALKWIQAMKLAWAEVKKE